MVLKGTRSFHLVFWATRQLSTAPKWLVYLQEGWPTLLLHPPISTSSQILVPSKLSLSCHTLQVLHHQLQRRTLREEPLDFRFLGPSKHGHLSQLASGSEHLSRGLNKSYPVCTSRFPVAFQNFALAHTNHCRPRASEARTFRNLLRKMLLEARHSPFLSPMGFQTQNPIQDSKRTPAGWTYRRIGASSTRHPPSWTACSAVGLSNSHRQRAQSCRAASGDRRELLKSSQTGWEIDLGMCFLLYVLPVSKNRHPEACPENRMGKKHDTSARLVRCSQPAVLQQLKQTGALQRRFQTILHLAHCKASL